MRLLISYLDVAPGRYVKDMAGAGEFYSNRVIKDNKESNPDHVKWARSFVAIWGAVEKFVKAHHTTGLVWNPSGGTATAATVAAPKPAAAAAPAATKPKLGGGGGGGGLFAELSKGASRAFCLCPS
jgi:adenylyl cyclase-associated protein